MIAEPAGTLPGPYDAHHVEGRPAYFARGVPVLEPDAYVLAVSDDASFGELGAVAFARDLARWLGRIFDRKVESVVYRENRWDHRPCPRAQTVELVVAGHTVLVTSYDRILPGRSSTCTVHAICVDGTAVPFEPDRPPRHLAWQLAWTAWRATT